MGLTKDERAARALVELWAGRLGLLPNWHIAVDFVPKLSGMTVAQVTWADGYQTARMAVSAPRWAAENDEGRHRVVIHELRHLVYAPVIDRLAAYCGIGTIVFKALAAEVEKVCDSDAGVFRRLYRRKRTVGG